MRRPFASSFATDGPSLTARQARFDSSPAPPAHPDPARPKRPSHPPPTPAPAHSCCPHGITGLRRIRPASPGSSSRRTGNRPILGRVSDPLDRPEGHLARKRFLLATSPTAPAPAAREAHHNTRRGRKRTPRNHPKPFRVSCPGPHPRQPHGDLQTRKPYHAPTAQAGRSTDPLGQAGDMPEYNSLRHRLTNRAIHA